MRLMSSFYDQRHYSMKPRPVRHRCFSALAFVTYLMFGHAVSLADSPRPSFTNTGTNDQHVLQPPAQFGTYRQNQPASSFTIPIYNRGTTAMSLTAPPVQFPLPPSPFSLQSSSLYGVPASQSRNVQL